MLVYTALQLSTQQWSTLTEEVNAEEVVDKVTEKWPVSAHLRGDLDGIKHTYHAVPLPVYVGDNFVEVQNMNETSKGALAEVHFDLHHYPIHKQNYDSFNATLKQIVILQPGKAHPVLPYEGRNVHDGPVHMQVTIVIANGISDKSQSFVGTGKSQATDNGERHVCMQATITLTNEVHDNSPSSTVMGDSQDVDDGKQFSTQTSLSQKALGKWKERATEDQDGSQSSVSQGTFDVQQPNNSSPQKQAKKRV